MNKRRIIFFSSVVVLAAVTIITCKTTKIVKIDQDFEGLSTLVSKSSNKKLKLITIHGIGRHCLGYSDTLVNGIVKKIGLQQPVKSYDQIINDLHKNKLKDVNILIIANKVKNFNDGKNLAQFGLDEALVNSKCEKQSSDKELESTNYNQIITEGMNTCIRLRKTQKINGLDCQAIQLKFKFKEKDSAEEKTTTQILGFIRTQDYCWKGQTNCKTNPPLTIYEIVWDPSTRWAKKNFTGFDKFYNRDDINKEIKLNIVNESISDAVMYLGEYKPIIQYTVLQGLCKSVIDSYTNSDKDDDNSHYFNCLSQITNNETSSHIQNDLREQYNLSVLTHSLGTRILFDALGSLSTENFLDKLCNDLKNLSVDSSYCSKPGTERIKQSSEFIKQEFSKSLSKIFVLANQVPLLDLAELQNPIINKPRELSNGFFKFVDERNKSTSENGQNREIKALEILAFTDPNDLLSYNLKCWYYLHVLRHKNKNLVDELYEKYKNSRPIDKLSKTKFFDRLFSNNCDMAKNDEFYQKYSRKLWEKIWDNERSVSLIDISVNLPGLKILPPIYSFFTDPKHAHSYFKNDDNIISLISCGGNKIGKINSCSHSQ